MTRTRIWIPEKQEKPSSTIISVPAYGLSGHVIAELLDHTGSVIERRETENVITDWWMDSIGSNQGGFNGANGWNDFMEYFIVGTGDVSGGISAHSTSLYALLDSSSDNGGFNDTGSWTYFNTASQSSGGYWSARRTRLFTETQANGILTEVGCSDGMNGVTVAATHAAFRDVSGALAPITKTSSNQLRISYEVRMTPPTELISGTFVLNGNTYNYILGPRGIADAETWGTDAGVFERQNFNDGGFIGDIFSAGFGYTEGVLWEYVNPPFISGSTWATSGSSTGLSYAFAGNYSGSVFYTSSYITGSFQRDVLWQVEPGSANFTNGYGGFFFGPSDWFAAGAGQQASYAIKFIPNILKTDTQRFKIVVRHQWSRSADFE